MKGGTWVLIAAGGLVACAAGFGLSRSTTGEKGGAVAVPSGPVTAPAPTTREAKSEPVEPPYEEPAPADDPRVVKWVFSAPAGVEMSRNEVTLDAYKRCYHAGACSIEGIDTVVYRGSKAQFLAACHWNDYRPEYARTADPIHPINCVSVSDAEAFCKWAGGRLPTYSEWVAEASNRAQRAYPWGDKRPSCEQAVVQEQMGEVGCGGGEWPVCAKPSGNSVSGLCDMIGNVSEYVSIDGGYVEVGGNAASALNELDADNLLRGMTAGPKDRDNRVGFRCARNATH